MCDTRGGCVQRLVSCHPHRENGFWSVGRFDQNLRGAQIADRTFVGKKKFGFSHLCVCVKFNWPIFCL